MYDLVKNFEDLFQSRLSAHGVVGTLQPPTATGIIDKKKYFPW
jgi:hypothetical protein